MLAPSLLRLLCCCALPPVPRLPASLGATLCCHAAALQQLEPGHDPRHHRPHNAQRAVPPLPAQRGAAVCMHAVSEGLYCEALHCPCSLHCSAARGVYRAGRAQLGRLAASPGSRFGTANRSWQRITSYQQPPSLSAQRPAAHCRAGDHLQPLFQPGDTNQVCISQQPHNGQGAGAASAARAALPPPPAPLPLLASTALPRLLSLPQPLALTAADSASP